MVDGHATIVSGLQIWQQPQLRRRPYSGVAV